MASPQGSQAARSPEVSGEVHEPLAARKRPHCDATPTPKVSRILFPETPNSSLGSVRSGASHNEVDHGAERVIDYGAERVITIGLYAMQCSPDRVRGYCDRCETLLFQTDLNDSKGACHYAILCKCTAAQSDCLVEFRRDPPGRVEISLGPQWFGLTAPVPKALALLWTAPACLDSFSEGELWDACEKTLDDLAQ